MAIELSNLTFTEQDDIVPGSGQIQILNSYLVNTLAGNDQITGIGNDYGFKNLGVLNTNDGDDIIIGSGEGRGGGYGIYNIGTLNAGEGNDLITGVGLYTFNPYYDGIYNIGTLNVGEGNDTITASANQDGIYNMGTLNTENGNDIITFYGE
jgi:hypothetical protein